MNASILRGAAAGILLLVGCDNGPSAVETRDRSGEAAAAAAAISTAGSDEAVEARSRPVLTASRSETPDAKLERLYQRNGAAFGARSPADYAARIEAFVGHPPAGVETVKRANGDTLYYQASTNTFAIADRGGVPRTMFKPDDAVAYWARQKETAPTFGRARRSGDAGG